MDGVETSLVRRDGRAFTKIEYSDTLPASPSRANAGSRDGRVKSEVDVTSNGEHVHMTQPAAFEAALKRLRGPPSDDYKNRKNSRRWEFWRMNPREAAKALATTMQAEEGTIQKDWNIPKNPKPLRTHGKRGRSSTFRLSTSRRLKRSGPRIAGHPSCQVDYSTI